MCMGRSAAPHRPPLGHAAPETIPPARQALRHASPAIADFVMPEPVWFVTDEILQQRSQTFERFVTVLVSKGLRLMDSQRETDFSLGGGDQLRANLPARAKAVLARFMQGTDQSLFGGLEHVRVLQMTKAVEATITQQRGETEGEAKLVRVAW
jgi:hypothetical protein